MLGGAPRIVVEWDVLVPDSDAEFGTRQVRLPRFYRVQAAAGGRVPAPRSGDYARAWMRVTGRRIERLDRLSPGVFVGVLCVVEVVTVTHDYRQQLLPDCARYSRIGRILERKAGSAPA
jgi:hypothetical protein